MPLRKPHGQATKTGRGGPRVEVSPADELPNGTPAPAKRKARRDARGYFVKGDPGVKALAAAGGKATKESRDLGRLLGLAELAEGHEYGPYARMARQWRDDHLADLAANVGGGVCGPGVASVVSTAALQLGASRYLHDRGAQEGDAKLLLDASRLADASRQNLLAAHELAAKEAQARAADRPEDIHAEVFKRFGGGDGGGS